MRSHDQIIELIKQPLSEKTLKAAKAAYESHVKHVTGEGVNKFLEKKDIAGYETPEAKLLRLTLNEPRTMPVIGEDIEVFDKAFSASGYTEYHDFGDNKALEKDFINYLNSPIADGYTLRQWMAQVWGKKIHYDFMGVAMVELPATPSMGRPEPYVIFKSINCIVDFGLKDGGIEYLIYEMREEKVQVNDKWVEIEYYRYIDADQDVIVIEQDDNSVEVAPGKPPVKKYTIPSEGVYAPKPNPLGRVPGVFLSTLRDGDMRQSYIERAIPHLDDLLLDSSIHAVSKKLFGFPQKWMYEQKCTTCSGEGKVNKQRIQLEGGGFDFKYDDCRDCKGSGQSYTMRPDKAIIKPMPDANNPDTGEPAGFVTPPIETLDNQVKEMNRLQSLVHRAVWQHEAIEGEQSATAETATGRMINISSYQSKLNLFTDNIDYVQHALIVMLGTLRYDKAYKGSVVNNGRRYYILSENQLEQNYKAAKEAGVSSGVLKSILESIVYVKYSNDPLELRKQVRLLQVEPMPTLTVEQVQDMQAVALSDKVLKTYFNDYVQEIENTKPDLFIDPSPEPLKLKLKELNAAKLAEINTNQPIPNTP